MKGIGVDVVSLAEMRGTLERAGDAFLERVFAPEERSEIPDDRGVRLRHIASRWAVKEAVFKCLGTTWTPHASFADIVVTRSPSGAPEVAVRGGFAAVLAARGGGALLVSLSVSVDTAIAVAAFWSEENDPHAGGSSACGLTGCGQSSTKQRNAHDSR